jgi:SprB repeat
MKKQILLLFGLLLSHFVFAQTVPVGNYLYNVSLTFGDPGHDCDCKNLLKLGLKFNDGDVILLDEDVHCRPNGSGFSIDKKPISASRLLIGFFTTSSRNTDNGLGCGNGTGINDRSQSSDITSHLCNQFYPNIMTTSYVLFGRTYYSTTWFSDLTIQRTPQLSIIDPSDGGSNDFEIDDPAGIMINSHSGFDPSEYNWEYLLPKINPRDPAPDWLPLTADKFIGKSSISLNIRNIIGDRLNPKNYYGRTLSIRQVGCGYTSKKVDYTMFKTPPVLVLKNTVPTTCNYKTDGKVQFTMSRPLDPAIGAIPAEKFNFPLLKITLEKPLGTNIEIKPEDISTSNDICTISNLAPGKYSGKYQTIYPDPSDLKNTLTSKEKIIAPFEITTSPALKYTARMGQPKCATDGAEIVVNATGGTPPYSYSINGAAAVKYIDTDEKGLPKGDYIIPLNNNIPNKTQITIKVTDSQGCVDGDTQAPQ